MTLGDKIRIARENSGMTMEELGKRCGTTKQTIYKYETGKVTNIPLDRLELIAKSVGVTAASLMGWEDKENQPTVSDGLTDVQRGLIEYAKTLSEEQAALALRVLKSVVGDDQ